MKNSESIRKRLDAIKGIDDPHEALSALADISFEIGMSACAERKQLQEEVRELRRKIVGNGNPANSIVSRLGSVEKSMENIDEKVSRIDKALLGDLENPASQEMSVLARLLNCEKINGNMVRLMWIIIGVVVVEIIATLLGLL